MQSQETTERRSTKADRGVAALCERVHGRQHVIETMLIQLTRGLAVTAEVERKRCHVSARHVFGEVHVVLFPASVSVHDDDPRRAGRSRPQVRGNPLREGHLGRIHGREHTPTACYVPPFMSALEHVLPPSATVESDHLFVGGCDLVALADQHGTPLVIYDEGLLRQTMREYRDAFATRAPGSEVLYASKAYFGQAVLRMANDEGLSVDVASGGELYAAVAAGFPAEHIYMHGNNKDARELDELMGVGVTTVIVDGFDEIALVAERAEAHGIRQGVLVRVTPGVEPDTHAFISTGQVDSKFGFPLGGGLAADAVARIRANTHLEFAGLHAHIGSQLLALDGFASAAKVMADFALSIGGDVRVLDMGGGLGIAYTRDEQPPSIEAYADAVVGAVNAAWAEAGLDRPKLLVEPGRSIVGRAGVTVYRVGGVKQIPNVRTYVGVDGGMSDLLRPMLYGATYEVVVANRAAEPTNGTARIVGKHCESGDVLVREASLPEVERGDLICLPATGAYGVSMASNYNGVTRPAVVFVDGGDHRVVTRRETYRELIARDIT